MGEGVGGGGGNLLDTAPLLGLCSPGSPCVATRERERWCVASILGSLHQCSFYLYPTHTCTCSNSC